MFQENLAKIGLSSIFNTGKQQVKTHNSFSKEALCFFNRKRETNYGSLPANKKTDLFKAVHT